METLADRAYRVATATPRASISLAALVQLLRADGCALSAPALEHALAADRRFHVLYPWRGTLAHFRPQEPAATLDRHRARIVVIEAREAQRTVESRVRRTLVELARGLDEGSAAERSRWLQLRESALSCGVS